MKDITFLIEELNSLPKGYISKKKINGKEYSYLQSVQNGKLQSTYVRETELEEVYKGLSKRKEIESELNRIVNTGKNAPSLSARARELTGSVMMGDIEVARFEQGDLTWIDKARAPLKIVRTNSLEGFLSGRAIDSSRTNSRILKKVLDIHGEPDAIVALHSYGATISDNYWFKTKGSRLKYEDIIFDNDNYCDIALEGKVLVYAKQAKLTPQLTLGGSYEKCWKQINGKWWLYKKGNLEEVFSECFCAKLAVMIGLNSVEYEALPGAVRTRNFAEKYNFEPMSGIAGEDDSFNNVFKVLDDIDEDIAKEFLKLIWFDVLVNNVDRHNENCGIMRNKKTGKIVSLAPNFDNNLALISRTRTLNLDASKDGLIKHFTKFVKNNPVVRKYYLEMEFPQISKKILNECMKSINCNEFENISKGERKQIIEFILGRANYLQRVISV